MDVDDKILDAQQAIEDVLVGDQPVVPNKVLRLTKLMEAIEIYFQGEK